MSLFSFLLSTDLKLWLTKTGTHHRNGSTRKHQEAGSTIMSSVHHLWHTLTKVIAIYCRDRDISVAYLNMVVIPEQQVGRLDVAVNDLLVMHWNRQTRRSQSCYTYRMSETYWHNVRERLTQCQRPTDTMSENGSHNVQDLLTQCQRPTHTMSETYWHNVRERLTQCQRPTDTMSETYLHNVRDLLTQCQRPIQVVNIEIYFTQGFWDRFVYLRRKQPLVCSEV